MVYHLPENHTFLAKLVYQSCLPHHRSQSIAILLGNILWYVLYQYIDVYVGVCLWAMKVRSWWVGLH